MELFGRVDGNKTLGESPYEQSHSHGEQMNLRCSESIDKMDEVSSKLSKATSLKIRRNNVRPSHPPRPMLAGGLRRTSL